MPIKPITVEMSDTTDGDVERARTRNTDRDEYQVALDGAVKGLKDSWEAAGKPDTANDDDAFKAAKRSAVETDKESQSEVKDMLRRAGRLYQVGIVYYKPLTMEDGGIKLRFTVGNPPKPKAKPSADEPTPAVSADASPAETDGAPEDTPDGSGEGSQSGRRFARNR